MKRLLLIATITALSCTLYAEGKSNKKAPAKEHAKKGKPGDEFRKTAAKYDALAKKEKNAEIAKAYKRMAAIKREAAKKGDAGKWKEISWKEYQALEAKIAKLKGHNKGKAKKK